MAHMDESIAPPIYYPQHAPSHAFRTRNAMYLATLRTGTKTRHALSLALPSSTQTQLWPLHPAVGQVLVKSNLAIYINGRPCLRPASVRGGFISSNDQETSGDVPEVLATDVDRP